MVAAVVVPAGGGRAGGLRAGGGGVAAQTRRGAPLRHAALTLPHLPCSIRQRAIQYTGTCSSWYL